MIVLRDPAQLSAHYDQLGTAIIMASLATALQQRFRDMSEGNVYDPEAHGYMVIAEPGDDMKALEEASCPIFSDWFGDSHYPDAGFAPSFEYAAEYPLYYEMVFIANDSGFAILVFVPKLTGIDAQLLSLCREYAEPAETSTIHLI
jgi:hypothetical protein